MTNSGLSNVEYQQVQQNLKSIDIKQQQLKFLSVMNSLNFQSIVERLETEKLDIFHFIGYSQLVDKNGEDLGRVTLENQLSAADSKDIEMFAQQFTGHQPKILILHGCETGKQSEIHPCSSLASPLILEGIPVAIAQ